jgi:hypothetical protein
MKNKPEKKKFLGKKIFFFYHPLGSDALGLNAEDREAKEDDPKNRKKNIFFTRSSTRSRSQRGVNEAIIK